ncbi:MAG: zinc-dependent alcohol dehydrogenase family protein [Candidatus Bipolaricaulota bacterium]|nr:zinc-dependent alcohol dehydrogenase family protein [Candidatus Bipolaricaulota bacterium]
MKAMVLKQLARLEENPTPLELETLPDPVPREREVLIKVLACGVCHTELDEIEGRTPPSQFPIILGHQVVGRIVALGPGARAFKIGDRVGVAWIFSACGQCKFCLRSEENLCYEFRATGRDAHGGYAEYMTVFEDFAYPIPEVFSDVEAAPLLCAGAIGYRSLRLTNLRDGQNLGLTGFGASAHLVLQLARALYPNTKIFVFARSETERAFARELGAVWAGDISEESPEKLDAIIDTTPVWRPIVESLKNLERGGRIVINAIRKEDTDKSALAQLDYATHLWLEKEIKSVANVTRRDVREFLEVASKIPIKPKVQIYKLEEANQALLDLKARKIRGAKVLKIE